MALPHLWWHFDSRSEFLFADGSMGRSVILFGADMSSSVHTDNQDINTLILGEDKDKYHINSLS